VGGWRGGVAADREETIQEQPVKLLGTTQHAKSTKIMTGDILSKEQSYLTIEHARFVNQLLSRVSRVSRIS